MQITKHPTKQVYVASQSITRLPISESGKRMPGFYIAEGYTEMQAIMGVTIMIAMMCIRFKTHPDNLELS